MRNKKTLLKEENSNSLHNRIKVSDSKYSKIYQVITKTLDILIPKTLKNWLNKQYILSNIPNDVILHAMDQMSQGKILEVEVILSNGTAVMISIHDIHAALKHLEASPFEQIIQSAMNSEFEDLKVAIIKDHHDLKNIIPAHELVLSSTVDIHKYFSIKGFDSDCMLNFIDHAPLFILTHLFNRFSDSAMWDTMKLLKCSDKNAVKKQLLYKVLDGVSTSQIMHIITMAAGNETTLNDAQLISLRNLLSMMQAEKVPFAISALSFPQKKSLLGQFRECPMGITMSIANGKMELYQIAAGLAHPKLVIDILNSVEWMDELQIRITRATLNLMSQSIQEIKNIEEKNTLKDKKLKREFSKIHDCCDQVSRLKNEKYHPFYQEINTLAKLNET